LITSHGSEYINRTHVRIIQTPQTFYSNVLKLAFEQPYKEAFTDEANVVEQYGIVIYLVEGEEQNIKITRPIDLFMAEKILEERNTITAPHADA
jgi:2-C-methyl-D-erythritol 4-phosphate cytidylyltransferase